MDTEFYNLDLNFRRYFWMRSPLQPYGIIGMGWSRAEIENGSTDGTVVLDAELEDGISFNVGAGIALYPLKWVCLYGQAMYRFVRFGSSDGIGGDTSNIGDVDGDSWSLSFGGALRILRGRD
jgi:opacity protein-like surface antigen